jgi:hypothetical protein
MALGGIRLQRPATHPPAIVATRRRSLGVHMGLIGLLVAIVLVLIILRLL